jgi:hypothetical protein
MQDRRLKLVKSPRRPSRLFRTGEKIDASGMYRVYHAKHRVPHEVTLIRGEIYPCCERCDAAVRFKLLRAIPEIDSDRGFVRLYTLPVMEEILALEEHSADQPKKAA